MSFTPGKSRDLERTDSSGNRAATRVTRLGGDSDVTEESETATVRAAERDRCTPPLD